MKPYIRKSCVALAEPCVAQDFLFENSKALIEGARKVDFRAGWKLIIEGQASWVTNKEFEKNFIEVKSEDKAEAPPLEK